MADPDEATTPSAGIILMVPRRTEGRSVDPNWDVLGMRADPQRFTGPPRMLAARQRRGASAGRYAAVPPYLSELVLGLVHPSLSRRSVSGVRRAAQGRPHPPTGRLRSAARLSPGRTPACRRDERRSRSGTVDHLPLGMAQRHGRAYGANYRRPLPG